MCVCVCVCVGVCVRVTYIDKIVLAACVALALISSSETSLLMAKHTTSPITIQQYTNGPSNGQNTSTYTDKQNT